MLESVHEAGGALLVGRSAELDLLESLWQDALGGKGRTALITGPAGIGKSRLVREMATRLPTDALVAFGLVYEGSGSQPFAPVHGMLTDLMRSSSEQATTALLNALESLSVGDDDVGREKQFDAVVSALECTAKTSRPCLLVIEDAHWADESTLRLLTHVARQVRTLPVLLLITRRPEETSAPAGLHMLAEAVRREYLGERVTLRPLTPKDARQLVLASGASLSNEAIDLLVERAEGNPFFLEELIRDAASSYLGPGMVPEAVADLVIYRLAGRALRTRDVAEAVAVLNENSRFPHLAEVLRTSREEVDTAVDDLRSAGILQVDNPAQVWFRHALFRDAVYGSIPSSRRAELHLRAANLLEAEQGIEAAAAAIAVHLEAEGSRESHRRAGELFATAAERSLRLLAYEDAASQFERALSLLDENDATPERQIELELSLAEARRLAGDADAALNAFLDCFNKAEMLENSRLEAEAALGYERAYLPTGRPRSSPDAHSATLLTRAIAAVGNSQLSLRSKLLSALSQARFFAGDAPSADSLSIESLALARQVGDSVAEAAALGARRLVSWGPDDPAGRLAISRSIINLALAAGERERELGGLYWEIGCLVEGGQIHDARRSLQRFGALAAELRSPLRLAEHTRMESMMAALRGELARARELTDEAYRLGVRAGYLDVEIHRVAALIDLLSETGEDAAIIETLVLDPLPWLQSPVRRSMLAYLSTRIGQMDRASKLVGGLATDEFASLPRDWMWLPLMYLLSEAVRRLGNAEWARMLYELLLPYGDQFVVNSNTVSYGSVEMALGNASATMRDPRAEAHYRRAAQRNRAIDAPLLAARAQERLGEVLLGGGRRHEAFEELAEASAAYHSLGLEAAEKRVSTLMPTDESETSRLSTIDGLTAREIDVLRLLAGGAGNKEVADRLYLSLRTVERHITNIYAKIDARGKADATAYALRHKLLN